MSQTQIIEAANLRLANTSANSESWQAICANTINDIDTLAARLALDPAQLAARTAHDDFTLKIPLPYVQRMQTGDINDPLLLQVLNRREEQQAVAGFVSDPLAEQQSSPVSGLIHKYPGRVLLMATGACPVHCRYCFRRHFPYEDHQLSPRTWQPALDYIAADSSISEVILSGGEPLMMKDAVLAKLLDAIEANPHVSLIRIHTRFPVVVPQRITATLVAALTERRCPVTVVLHTNHPNEINALTRRALAPLAGSPVTLLNQAVLLHGINDSADTLEALSRQLFAAGVLPYYLHVLDPVTGTAHFNVDDDTARALHSTLVDRLPGYLVPTLVREVPGRQAKTRLR